MTTDLRSRMIWHKAYHPEWDETPDEYAEQGIVQWGRSRRLGLFRAGDLKAYLGVQHVDPGKPGWNIVEEPQARFFLSLFVSGRCIALRTFLSVDAALDILEATLNSISQK